MPSVAAFRAVRELAGLLSPSHREISSYEARRRFTRGEAAMWMTGSWQVGKLISGEGRKKVSGVLSPPAKGVAPGSGAAGPAGACISGARPRPGNGRALARTEAQRRFAEWAFAA